MIVKNYFAEYMPFDFGKLVQQFALVHSLPDYWSLEWFEFESAESMLTAQPLYSLNKFRLWVPDNSPLLDFVELLSAYFVFNIRPSFSGRFKLRGKYPK